jgi:hypothetical protein
MVGVNVVRVDFARARALRARDRPGFGWSHFGATISVPGAPSRHAPLLSPLLARFLARYRARRATAVDRILRKGIASLE